MGIRDAAFTRDAAANARIFGGEQVSVANGNTSTADVRGMKGIVAYGTGTYQPCDDAGVPVAGSAATPFVSGKLVNSEWTHYLVTGGAGGIVYAIV